MLLFFSFILFNIEKVHSDDSICPSGSDYIAQLDTCLAVVKNGARFGFYQADVECAARGGQLTSVHNAFENTLIYGVASFKEDLQTGAYIGALRTSGQWMWVDGSNMTYSNWAAGQPTEQDDCAILRMSDSKWYSESCGQQNATYLCTLHPQRTTSVITTTSSSATPKPILTCYAAWTLYNGNCYLFRNAWNSHNMIVNWTTTQSRCEGMGGNLASIHSAEENTFLSYFANSKCVGTWIGLQWNGSYSWSDGSAVDFNRVDQVAEGEPPYVFYLLPACFNEEAGVWGNSYTSARECSAFICKQPASP